MRLALLISGGGTTAGKIILAAKSKILNVDPVLVIASNKNIEGIKRIKETGFPEKNIRVINPKKFNKPEYFAQKLITVCREYNIEIVGQYGWLPLTPLDFIRDYENKIINQHPGPLDESGIDFGGKGMYGRRVHSAVIYFRRKTKHDYWTEATSHFVTADFDRGNVIGRIKIPISNDDTVESLQNKVLPIEHKLQIDILKNISTGKLKILKRPKPLINSQEINILEESKKIAAVYYPQG